jgi:hypothetical protein
MAITAKQVVLKNVRLAFPDNLWVAGVGKGVPAGTLPKFGCTLLIEPGSENDKAIQAAIVRTTNEKFKDKAQFVRNKIKGNSGTCCYLDGNERVNQEGKIYDGFENMMALKVARREKDGAPRVVTSKNKDVAPGEPGAPYGGCYVNAIVEPFAYDNVNKGVSSGLVLVQFAKDGKAFGGGASKADADALPALEFDEDEEEMEF